METKFRWTCSYMGCVDFEVIDPIEGRFEIEERREASDYERSISSYDDDGWQRCIVASIGTIRRRSYTSRPIPERIVDAFNAWRAAEHEAARAKMLAQPHRYGSAEELEPWLEEHRPPAVVGAHYDAEQKAVVRSHERQDVAT